MNDAINRKDTIGAILSIRHIAELSDGDAVIRVSAVNYVLRNLPSADVQAEKKFQKPECKGFGEGVAYRCGWNDAIDAIMDNEPSADLPVRNTAEWVYGEKDGADGWYCSKCGFHIPWYYDYYGLKNIDFIRDFHTCPHCDAKMVKYTGMKEGEQDG